MIRLQYVFLAFLLTTVSLLTAQNFDFGKVSMEELKASEHHTEKDARASVLYKRESVYYDYNTSQGWSMNKEVHFRIKIYNKEGFDWATLQVPLYKSSAGQEKINGIKGITFNVLDGKVVEEKLRKDGIFTEEVSENQKKVSITMPKTKEGSVLDIEYKISSPIYWYMRTYNFQYDIPVELAEVKLQIPEYFVFSKFSSGFYPLKINQNSESRTLNLSYRTTNNGGFSASTTRKSGSITFKENVFDIKGEKVPSLKEENYTNNIDNYRTSLKFELASTKFPDSPYKNYSKSWEDVAKSISEYSNFGDELEKTKYFEKDIDALLKGLSTNEEKISAIFSFVKSKVKWNDYVGTGCSNGVKKAYDTGTGNVAEINLMLTAMLRYAKLKANPVLVSTKSHGIPLFPTTEGFNYVISAIDTDSGPVLLDATRAYTTSNILPVSVMNWKGLLLKEDGFDEISLINKKASGKLVSLMSKINADGSINGKVRVQYTNQLAYSFRNNYSGTEIKKYVEDLQEENENLEIGEYNVKNADELTKPVIVTYDFVSDQTAESIGDKLYFSPMMFLATTENPFKLENRAYPVDFLYPTEEKLNYNISIPEGYQVESLPSNIAVKMPDGLGVFNFSIMNNKGSLQLVVRRSINVSLLPTDYYTAVKDFYRQMVIKETEKVVLSKV